MRTLTRRAACLATLALLAPARLAAAPAANLAATPDKPARVPLPANRAANAVLVDLYARAYTPPKRGAVEAVVSVGPEGQGMEIGRFAVFPAEPFLAANPQDQRGYRFDASAALAAFKDKPLVVEVKLVPTDAKVLPEGAMLTLSRVELSARPGS